MGMMNQAMPPPAATPPEESAPAAQPAEPETGAAEAGGGEAASPEEQAEYERAMGALYTLLYKDDKVSASIVEGLNPQDKVGSVVRASLTVLRELDEKIQMDEVVIPQMAEEVPEQVLSLAEAKGMQFSEPEIKQIAGAVMEGAVQIFGTVEDGQAYVDGMDPAERRGAEQAHQQMLAEAGG